MVSVQQGTPRWGFGVLGAAESLSDESDDDPAEVLVGVRVAEGVYGAVDVAQSVAEVVEPEGGAGGTLGHHHHQTAEGRPADYVTSQDRAQHLQRLDMSAAPFAAPFALFAAT